MKKQKKDAVTGSEDPAVGYKNPPKKNQFVKGQSGNPSGRPKAKPSWAKIWEKSFEELITHEENGGKQVISKFEACCIHLANKASSGNATASRFAISLTPTVENALNLQSTALLNDAEDLELLGYLMAEFKQFDDELNMTPLKEPKASQ